MYKICPVMHFEASEPRNVNAPAISSVVGILPRRGYLLSQVSLSIFAYWIKVSVICVAATGRTQFTLMPY